MLTIPDVTDLDVAFGNVKHLPDYDQIPETFRNDRTTWHKLFTKWFYEGADANWITAKPEVDKAKAIRALQSIMVSRQPQHEHKEAGVAYLMSEWFDSWQEKQSEAT